MDGRGRAFLRPPASVPCLRRSSSIALHRHSARAISMQRIHKEIKRLPNNMAPGPYVKIHDEGTHFEGQLAGPHGSVFEGRLLSFRMTTEDHPMAAPKIWFDPPLYHVHCQLSTGRIMYSDTNDWSPALMLGSVFIHLQWLLANPFENVATACWRARGDSAMVELNELAQRDPDAYMARAREHTNRHHPLPPYWSIATNAGFSTDEQRRVRFMLWIGRTLAARFPGEETGFTDNWIERVMPRVIGRVPLPSMLTQAQELSVEKCRLDTVCRATQALYEDGFHRLHMPHSDADETEIDLRTTKQVIGALGYARRWGEESNGALSTAHLHFPHLRHDSDLPYSCTAETVAKTLGWEWPESSHRVITHLSQLESMGLVRRLGSSRNLDDDATAHRTSDSVARTLWVIRSGCMNHAGTRVDFRASLSHVEQRRIAARMRKRSSDRESGRP